MQYSSIIAFLLLGFVYNVVLATQLRILAGSNDNMQREAYASIVEIDTTTNIYTVIRDKVQLYPGRTMMIATSGTLNGTDCYILAVFGTIYQFSLQYFRMSDGVLLLQSPAIRLTMLYDSIVADETKELNILVQAFDGPNEEVSYFVNALSGKSEQLENAENVLDNGLYTYLGPPRVFSVMRTLNCIFSYEYATRGTLETIMDLDYCGKGVDVWGNKGEYYVLTPCMVYRCPAVAQTVCSEFINIQVNLTIQYTNHVVRGVTFDKEMKKMYFIGDPQTLYTVDVATQMIESQISVSQLFDKYPQLRDLRVYEQ